MTEESACIVFLEDVHRHMSAAHGRSLNSNAHGRYVARLAALNTKAQYGQDNSRSRISDTKQYGRVINKHAVELCETCNYNISINTILNLAPSRTATSIFSITFTRIKIYPTICLLNKTPCKVTSRNGETHKCNHSYLQYE